MQRVICWWLGPNSTAPSSDIYVALYDPSANGGAGGWMALGGSLGSGGISGTGAADHAVIVNVTSGANSGPVVAWLDSSTGTTNVYAKRFNGSAWVEVGTGSASGNGISQSATNVTGLALATDGTKLAVAWAQPFSGQTEIYLRENSGAGWTELSGSASSSGVSANAGTSNAPTLAYFGGALYVAWQDDTSGKSEIYAEKYAGGAWSAAGVGANFAGGVSNTDIAATQPQLSAGGGKLHLLWLDERTDRETGQFTAIFAEQWNGNAFVEELPGDASLRGISPTGGEVISMALDVDAAGHPFVAWADRTPGTAEIYFRGNTFDLARVFYVNDASRACDLFTSAVGNDANNGLTPATPKRSIQSVLNAYDLSPGDVILVDAGTYGGTVTISANDNGVLILGAPGSTLQTHRNLFSLGQPATIITGSVNVQTGAVLQDLALRGGINFSNATNASLQHSVVREGGITISGGSGVQIVHNDIAATGVSLTLAGTSAVIIEHNQIVGGTVGIAIMGASSGHIADNQMSGASGIGLKITAPFTGLIEHNALFYWDTGVAYGAAAGLSANDIYRNTLGVHATVAGDTEALGFVSGTEPNEIYKNDTGVLLEGRMQRQHIYRNPLGVDGSGILGPDDLAQANLIERNETGTQFSGVIQFNRFNHNAVSIEASDDLLIIHNLLYQHTDVGVLVDGRTDVRIYQNTFYTRSGDNVRVTNNASEVELLNNILWTEDGYDIDLDVLSRHGFYSDYNVLHASRAGILVHFAKDFTDILDWQQDVYRFDLHSMGTTVVNPDWSEPRFVAHGLTDYHMFDLTVGATVLQSHHRCGRFAAGSGIARRCEQSPG